MAYTYEYPHPAVTTDAIVFTVRDGRLEVLLIQRRHEPFKDMWAFPGGFLDYEEDLLDCAKRELAEETGVSGVELEQFHAAGAPGRDPRERNISIVHMGLLRPDQRTPRAGDDASEVGWFNAHRPPPLAFDHRELLALARRHLAEKLMRTPAALEFLPRLFTQSQLKTVYDAVLNRRLDQGNFRRLARSMDCIRATGQYAKRGRVREPLYGAARASERRPGRRRVE
ncbi:MAG: NUDIX domain-containing protein [Chromatiales bacterium]